MNIQQESLGSPYKNISSQESPDKVMNSPEVSLEERSKMLSEEFKEIIKEVTKNKYSPNFEVIDYEFNRIANTTHYLKNNLTEHTLKTGAAVENLEPSQEEFKKAKRIMREMSYSYLVYDKKEESLGKGNYETRRALAKELVSVLVPLINKKWEKEASKTLH